jgi:RNA polymerase sigma factor (sigma-70 family)
VSAGTVTAMTETLRYKGPLTLSIQANSGNLRMDRDLLAEFKISGSHEVYTEIVRQYTNLVYSTCARILGDPSGADDATQATFLVLLRKGRSLPRETVLSSWLFKVAEFTARHAVRSRLRRTHHEREAILMTTHETTQWAELKPYLDSALAKLPDIQRDVIVLRYIKGLSRAEVARELRCPEKTVQTRLARAMEGLRAKLQRRGIFASISVLATMISQNTIQNAPAGLSSTIAGNCLAGTGTTASVVGLADATLRAMALAKITTAAMVAAVVLAVAAPAVYVAASRMSAPDTATPVIGTAPELVSQGQSFYVAPDGKAASDGSPNAPWNLATVLAHPKSIKPGDTIWLRGGTYTGKLVSKLRGTSDKPIILRQYPNERAVLRSPKIDGSVLTVEGAHTWYWGFEVTNPGPRNSGDEGSWPRDLSTGDGISGKDCDHIRFINLFIHDVVGSGISLQEDSSDCEIHGCIINNNGWEGATRGHGSGINLRNKTGTKTISDNIVFHQYNCGVYVYGGENAMLNNMRFEGNILSANGAWPQSGGNDFLIGGGVNSTGVVFNRNYTYSIGNTTGNFGFDAGRKQDCSISENIFAGSVHLQGWEKLNFTKNTIVSYDTAVNVTLEDNEALFGYQWDANRYHVIKRQWPAFGVGSLAVEFPEWCKRFGHDANSVYTSSLPRDTQVFVRKNNYEQGRAHIAVYNWAKKKSVTVDVSNILAAGTHYELKSVLDLSGKPLSEGISNGSTIEVPLNSIPPKPPDGAQNPTALPAEDQFHVFVLIPQAR